MSLVACELRTTFSAVKDVSPLPAGSKTMKRHRSSVVAAGAVLCVSLMPAAWAESLTLEQEIAKLKNSEDGSPVEIKSYPSAVHAFDTPDLERRELPAYRSGDGPIPAIATDDEARADAVFRVLAFLKARLD